jgi:hypothetical protein
MVAWPAVAVVAATKAFESASRLATANSRARSLGARSRSQRVDRSAVARFFGGAPCLLRVRGSRPRPRPFAPIVSLTSILCAINRGELRATKLNRGRIYRIHESWVDTWLSLNAFPEKEAFASREATLEASTRVRSAPTRAQPREPHGSEDSTFSEFGTSADVPMQCSASGSCA